MAIASSVEAYLGRSGVRYELIGHARTGNSCYSAHAAHVPGSQFAKCVMLEDDRGYLMAILPATRKVDLGALRQRLGRPLGLATENELAGLFLDCEQGAIPPLGGAYGIDAILDQPLVESSDVYFEAGDHRELVHVSGSDFLTLMGDAPRGRISHERRHERRRSESRPQAPAHP